MIKRNKMEDIVGPGVQKNIYPLRHGSWYNFAVDWGGRKRSRRKKTRENCGAARMSTGQGEKKGGLITSVSVFFLPAGILLLLAAAHFEGVRCLDIKTGMEIRNQDSHRAHFAGHFSHSSCTYLHAPRFFSRLVWSGQRGIPITYPLARSGTCLFFFLLLFLLPFWTIS